jgi:hypothetical protein
MISRPSVEVFVFVETFFGSMYSLNDFILLYWCIQIDSAQVSHKRPLQRPRVAGHGAMAWTQNECCSPGAKLGAVERLGTNFLDVCGWI